MADRESFESHGAPWHLAHVTPGIRKAFASWARYNARQRLADDREVMAAKDYAEEKAALAAAIDAGEYDWGPPSEIMGTGIGPRCMAALKSAAGVARVVQLLLEPVHGPLTDEQVLTVIAGSDAEAFKDALAAALELPRPNPPAPATTQTPGTSPTPGTTPTIAPVAITTAKPTLS